MCLIFASCEAVFLKQVAMARTLVIFKHPRSDLSLFTAHNARIASAVLATAIPSVCLSVCPSVTCRYCVKTTARSTVQFAPMESKMCLVL